MRLFRIGVAAAWVLLAQSVVAADFPTRPITMVVPFAAGGGTDIVARMVAEKMGESLKMPVVIDNKPGASAQIGTRYVINAAPDGYTILVGTTSLINGPFLFPKLNYDATKQLRPVASLADLPIFLAVSSKHNVKNVREFVDLAKKSKGNFNYGSAGAGTTLHMGSEWLKMNGGFEATHVAYKGSGLAVAALGAGTVDFNMENLGPVLPMVQGNRVKLLAIAAPQRHPRTPDVPTVAESGLPDANLSTWIFLMAPAGTPDDVVNLLNREANQVLQRPDVREKLIAQGFFATGGSTADMLKRMNVEATQWGTVIRKANITVE